jgi:hypothetical protein
MQEEFLTALTNNDQLKIFVLHLNILKAKDINY